MGNIAIIPARGGSKRISKKNIKTFLGKPIIAYSIEVALQSGLFDEVMVSTDDDIIAEIGKHYGAKIPFMRSKKNADDFATTYDVIEEVLLSYKKEQLFFDFTCCIYPCAPLLNVNTLNKAFDALKQGKADSCFPVIKYGSPIQRALRIKKDNLLESFNPEFVSVRSQDIEPAYFDAGQFYWFHTNAILEQKKILTTNTISIVLEENEAQDIDNEIDWQIAELKYKLLNHESI